MILIIQNFLDFILDRVILLLLLLLLFFPTGDRMKNHGYFKHVLFLLSYAPSLHKLKKKTLAGVCVRVCMCTRMSAEEMSHQLNALAPLPEDLGSIPVTYTAAHNRL